jgi:anthranilate phosphoribosyltransferase
MVGVFARPWVEPLAHVLGALGMERAFVVHGSDGLDEITTTGPTYVAELANGKVRTFEITPEEVGLKRANPADLKGGDAAHNAAALRAVLDGKPGPFRDVALLNAAAALVVAGKANDLKDGLKLAAQSVDSGGAKKRLERLVAVSNG